MPRRPRFARDTRIKLAGASLHFNFEGEETERWLARLDNFKTSAKNLQPVFDEFGQYMLRSIDRNFQSEGRPDAWKPLAPSTVRQRIRLGFGGSHPILQRSGKLRGGFRTQTDKSFLRIVNNVPYFKYHQQDDGQGNKMPRRIMVILQQRDKAEFTRIVRKHLGLE